MGTKGMSERDILTCKGGCGQKITRGKAMGRLEWIFIHRDMAYCPTCYADQHEMVMRKPRPFDKDIVSSMLKAVKEDDRKRTEGRKKRA